MGLFDEFMGGTDGFDMESFFTIPNKEAKNTEKKKEKSETSKKEKKDKNKKDDKNIEVTLPVTIKARGFEVCVEGKGQKKLSEIVDWLKEQGYEQFYIPNFGFTYRKSTSEIFVSDNTLTPNAKDELVELEEGEEIIVCDGQLKASYSLADFPGIASDELSVSMILERFEKTNPNYKGCSLCYDADAQVAYPYFYPAIASDFKELSVTEMVKHGNVTPLYNHESLDDIIGETGETLNMNIDKVEVVVQHAKTSNIVFISYKGNTSYIYQPDKKGGSKEKPKKVEKKYELPFEVLVVNGSLRYMIDSEKMGGKEKVTIEEIKEYLGGKMPLFKDASRKVDVYYYEEQRLMSFLFISGSKGCELLRTMGEFEEAKKKEYFDGIYAGEESVRIRALPHGNFLSYKGKEKMMFTTVRMEWERKLPKIPMSLLDEVIQYFREDITREAMVRIFFHKEKKCFYMEKADGIKTRNSIYYEFSSNEELMQGKVLQVMDIHSHNTMPAYFSPVDDRDEADYPGLFGVIGNLHDIPQCLFRAGVDGVFQEYPLGEFFGKE